MVADVPRQVSLRRFLGSNVLSYYVIVIFIYNNTYNRVTSICIDLSKYNYSYSYTQMCSDSLALYLSLLHHT